MFHNIPFLVCGPGDLRFASRTAHAMPIFGNSLTLSKQFWPRCTMYCCRASHWLLTRPIAAQK